MKRLVSLLMMMVVAVICVTTANAQSKGTPWKILNMEDATRWGSNASYDDETCLVEFEGSSDRWIDVPGVSGDLTGHTKLELDVLKSNCVLRVWLRYKDAAGKTQQVACQTFYGQMGKEINVKKVIKCDLSDGGKVPAEALKNVVSIRLSMARGVAGVEAPWSIQFGKVYLY